MVMTMKTIRMIMIKTIRMMMWLTFISLHPVLIGMMMYFPAGRQRDPVWFCLSQLAPVEVIRVYPDFVSGVTRITVTPISI